MRYLVFTVAVLGLSTAESLHAQTKHDLDLLDSNYLHCIRSAQDTEKFVEEWWPDCWDKYTRSLDSLEDVAFTHLLSATPSAKQDLLKSSELKWYGKRDAYYKKEDRSDDDELIPYKKAEYVEKHILYLLKSIDHSKPGSKNKSTN
ncbi:MAG: hypothetical protein Q8916_14195 [Bacteroidota bacterium]|nr:hypothetical protein [Bacteroidota bacterium]MDP4231545.1 hypothetical protein [Bacteroidota bacterium]MDP4237128.1 hypothetical protein [Bacteroidota bacterium]